MEDCIFCKIIKGEVPSYKIYEDDFVFAFLDINPLAKGHTLIIPKKHKKDIFEVEDLDKIAIVAKFISKKIKEVLNCEGINIYHASGEAAGQTVFHFHVHIIPRNRGDDINFSSMKGIKMEKEEFENLLIKLKIEEKII
jgi:histidine triad (HIT) family protein